MNQHWLPGNQVHSDSRSQLAREVPVVRGTGLVSVDEPNSSSVLPVRRLVQYDGHETDRIAVRCIASVCDRFPANNLRIT